jgi:hypothetical protein
MFAYRWMNCFLIREMPLKHVLRVWDSYLSEEETGFAVFHVYFCAALLKFLSVPLKSCGQDLEKAIGILNECRDVSLTEKDVEEMLSTAFIFQTQYKLT